MKDALDKIGKEEKKEEAPMVAGKKKFSVPGAEPFVEIFRGFRDIGGAIVTLPEFRSKDKKKPTHAIKKEIEEAQDGVIKATNKVYKTFKQSHGMLAF